MSISEIIDANGVFFVTIFLGLSVSAVTLIVWRMWLNYSAKTNLEDFIGRVQAELDSRGTQGALEMCQQEPGLVPKLFVSAMEHGQRGKLAVRNAMSNTIELEIVPSLNFLLPWILLFAKIAPMVGLLGTVVGMIKAFQKIAGATKVDPGALANDIGMALFTTAEGLIIAIPLIFAYTMFRERVHSFEVSLQRGAEAALQLLPRMFGRQPAAATFK